MNLNDETEADDEFFNELADSIEQTINTTKERLANGELDRRRQEIMARIFDPTTTEPEAGHRPT